MTEYWKSQARKFCDFCKCWFADNKVSISFHENGKRHKENVQKHISKLSKKSVKEFKHKEKIDDDIKKMEAAAMAAYLKDVQNNADLTSQNINVLLNQNSSDEKPTVVVSDASQKKPEPAWHELKSDDGNSYFWHTITNETTWDAPDEYLSLADQEKKKLKEQEKREKKKQKQEEEKNKEVIKETKAYIAREKMRELAAKKDTSQPTRVSLDYGPTPRAEEPYGAWKPIVKKPVESVDLQLPKADKELPPVVMEPERIQFKEKRVNSLGDGPVEFKKRKLNNPKRNTRQKLDDD